MTIHCPSCAAEIVFRSDRTVYATCRSCGSLVVRTDLKVELIGKEAGLPNDLSPLCVGAKGKFEGKAFEIVGRARMRWEDGAWNEWYVLFADGTDGWIGEAQGEFTMLFRTGERVSVPPKGSVRPEQEVRIGKSTFVVTDVKDCTYVGSEGELPERPQLPTAGDANPRTVSVDLDGPGLAFASIEYSDDGTQVYVGRIVEWEELEMSGTRRIEGWS